MGGYADCHVVFTIEIIIARLKDIFVRIFKAFAAFVFRDELTLSLRHLEVASEESNHKTCIFLILLLE